MTAPIRPQKQGRKFDQVLNGAREVFLAQGFEGASVDDIAKAAGVSKATLYSYFSDKRLLFLQVATVECRRQTQDALDEIDTSQPPSEVLTYAAERMTNFFLSDFGRAVFRCVVAETVRFPEIGREFWENGPEHGRSILIGYFEEAIARGELDIDDLRLAADQFAELCKADLWPRLMMGVLTDFTEQDRRRVIDGAVATFLARYGTAKSRVQATARELAAAE